MKYLALGCCLLALSVQASWRVDMGSCKAEWITGHGTLEIATVGEDQWKLVFKVADRLHLPGFPRESEYHFPGWIRASSGLDYYGAELQARVYPDIDVDSDGDPIFLEKGDPGWGFFRVFTMSVDTDLSYELAESEGPPMPLELVWNDFQLIHRFRHWSEANAGDAGVDYLRLPESRVIFKIADYEWGAVEPNEETTVYFDFPLWRTANTVNKLDKCRCRLYPHLTNC